MEGHPGGRALTAESGLLPAAPCAGASKGDPETPPSPLLSASKRCTMRGGTARARGGKNASYLARSRPTNTRCVETVVGMVCKWTEMYTVLSDTFGDILICVLRPARISRPRTCRAPSAERTPERGRHFEQGASPRARRDARAAFYSISFSGAFSLCLYTGAAYAAISVKI